MNNVNMANMTAMAGAPTGGPMGMMPGGAGPTPMTNNSQATRAHLHTCIYEYFLNQGMYDSARTLLQSDSEIKLKDSTRRDADGNIVNGVNDDSMDTDSKDDADSKRPSDLPLPSSTNNFLYEWFCLFWDMQVAVTKRSHSNTAVGQYLQHTQQQNRFRQNQQQELLRSMRPDGMFNNQNPMMRNMPNGMQMQKQQNLVRTALANNTNNPQAMQMLQKQGQMAQNATDMDANRRPGSPGSEQNAPSPNKRPRLDGAGPFNQQQAAMMQNGQRPQQGMPGQQVPNAPANNAQAAQAAQQMLLTNGINPSQLTPQQFQQFQNQPPHAQVKSIQTYSQNLQQHHGQQMPNKQGANPQGPQGQGSPMMAQGPDGANLNAYYHPGEMGNPAAMRPGAPGAVQGAGGSNHALQDYQMQLMLLEQQNKKRLMMARQEQDSMGNMPRADGQPGPAGAPGPNGQGFQDASPQAARTGTSPNPSEQMKRGTPQMNPAGIPSPLPEGAQSRGSPNPMNFMPNNMDPNMAPHFFKGMNGGMEGNMGNVPMNGGMRPPSSHPGQPGFNGQMNPQMAAAARQNGQNPQMWQGQPNGNGMAPGAPQGQVQGTPQQRAMPPPSAPATGAAANANASGRATASPQQGNAAPPTPQQSNKAAPKKKDTKNAKTKAAANKKANANTGATPASENAQDQEPPTPATPITPAANAQFPKGPNAAPASTAAAAPTAAAPAPQPDPNQMGTFSMEDPNLNFNMDFANPTMSENVLQDFDFDSFLHDDADGANFGFDPSAFGMEGAGEIGAD